jgi:hypothetical protein
MILDMSLPSILAIALRSPSYFVLKRENDSHMIISLGEEKPRRSLDWA